MLTLHLGLHKTGTSSIQLALKSAGFPRRVSVPRDGRRLDAQVIEEAIRALPDNGIWSDENSLGSPANGYANAAERLEALANGVGGRNCQIIIYVRPQLTWLQSLYIQEIQEGGSADATAFVERAMESGMIDWTRLISQTRKQFPSALLRIRPFHKGLDVVEDFSLAAGISLPKYSARRQGRVNISIGPLTASVMREVNRRHLLTPPETQEFRSWLQRNHLFEPERYSLFPVNVQELVRNTFQPRWEELSRSHLLSAVDRDAFSMQDAAPEWEVLPEVLCSPASPTEDWAYQLLAKSSEGPHEAPRKWPSSFAIAHKMRAWLGRR